MGKRPYRVEMNFPIGRRPQAYLVKDVRVGDKRSKVRIYLPVVPQTATEKAAVSSKHAAELELKAAEKKGELSLAAYKAEYLPPERLRDVEQVRSIYNSVLGFLTVNEVQAYEDQFEISYIQGTTSIEGNTLTLSEVQNLLVHDVMPAAKSLREINEVQNFKKVVAYRTSYRWKVTQALVKHVHSLVMDNIDRESAGLFRRRDDLGIAGCDLQVTPSAEISHELDDAIAEYYQALRSGKHPFEQAIRFHYKFEMIHPFTDGNGRVGREILNYMLTRARYPRLLFLGKDRSRYLDALKCGNNDDFSGLVDTFAELIVDQRLKILQERLEQTAGGVKRYGQTLLTDYVAA